MGGSRGDCYFSTAFRFGRFAELEHITNLSELSLVSSTYGMNVLSYYLGQMKLLNQTLVDDLKQSPSFSPQHSETSLLFDSESGQRDTVFMPGKPALSYKLEGASVALGANEASHSSAQQTVA